MSTKLSQSGTYLEYVTVKPVGGLNLDQIATAIMMYHQNDYDTQTYEIEKHNLKMFFAKYNTWNKIMARVKFILWEEGMVRLDYAWENIVNYDEQLKYTKERLSNFNSLIGKTKENK